MRGIWRFCFVGGRLMLDWLIGVGEVNERRKR